MKTLMNLIRKIMNICSNVDKKELWILKNYIEDLKVLYELIEKSGIDCNLSKIEDIITDLEEKETVDYNFSDLEFYINMPMKGTKPSNITYGYIVIKCNNQLAISDPIEKNKDSIHIFNLDIKIELKKSKRCSGQPLQSSWHLDKEKNPDICRYTHPYYHFQFGGKNLEYIEEGLGLLSSPRIPHPPMDLILLFHFILNNFYDNKKYTFVAELLANADYQRILKNSKNRIWDDYFKSFDAKNNHLHYTFGRVFPLYQN